MVLIFLTRFRCPSRLSIAEVLRKRYGDQTLKLVRKIEKKEEIYNKKLVVRKLDRESKLLYNNVKSNLNLIDFHHVLNISLISNEKG